MSHVIASQLGDDQAADGTEIPALGRSITSGLGWSLLNNVVGRVGNFLAGIIVVRILSESQFGTYAVGMVVLSVLLSMNELGVSVAIIQRKGSVAQIAPTVVTLSIISSVALAAMAFVAAPWVAETLNAPDATWLIRLLIAGVVIDGVCAVPNALITRAMQQRKRLLIDTAAFLVGTPVTIVLALQGFGAWSLGWGAVIGNIVTGVLGFLLAPARYRPGWRREHVRELLGFGLPLAGASLLLFLMLNVDYLVVGHLLGSAALGLYLLAFNLCSWPITVFASALRRVTLAAFARMGEQESDGGKAGFAMCFGLALAAILPVCAGLALYAEPVIEILYGRRWLAAAPALQLLVVFSIGRVAVELTYDFLAANGRTMSTVWLHVIWLVALVPTLVAGARIDAIRGVAAGHALVVVVVLVPTLAILLHRAGMSLRLIAVESWRPVAGVAVMAMTVPLAGLVSDVPAFRLGTGVALGALAYGLLVLPMRRSARALVALGS